MISGRTLVSFLLAALLGLGLWNYALGHRDECDRQPKVKGQTAYIDVQSGSHLVSMPCTLWVARQRQSVQGLWLLDVLLGVVFGVSLAGDWVRWRAERTQWSG